MKTEISNKIKLGIFISVGMLIFIVGIYFIGEGQQLFRRTFRISGVFKDVAGLQAGNNVRLSGVNVGTVDNIRIVSDSTIRVEILIDEDTRMFIKRDAVATIGSEGLMGNKVLIITPGIGGMKEIRDNDTIETNMPMNLDDVFISLKSTIDNASNITRDLSKITFNIQSGHGTIGKLLMDSSMRKNFDSTVINIKKGSDEFRSIMAKANHLDDVLVSLRTTMDNTAIITSDVAAISGTLRAGKGTMGRLFMDSTLGQNVDTTFLHLKDGSAGLKLLMNKAKRSWLLWGID